MNDERIRMAGCLFWTERDGEKYVLLSLPGVPGPFFPAGYYSVPSGLMNEGEDEKDAAMRVGFEKTGVLDNKSKARLLWCSSDEGLYYPVYSLKVSPSVKESRFSKWFALDGELEDVSALARMQIRFLCSESGELSKAV